MTALFIAAQLADLATFHAPLEANPIVLALGPAAVAAKLGLIAAVPLIARLNRYRVRVFVLALGTAVGTVGAWSNL